MLRCLPCIHMHKTKAFATFSSGAVRNDIPSNHTKTQTNAIRQWWWTLGIEPKDSMMHFPPSMVCAKRPCTSLSRVNFVKPNTKNLSPLWGLCIRSASACVANLWSKLGCTSEWASSVTPDGQIWIVSGHTFVREENLHISTNAGMSQTSHSSTMALQTLWIVVRNDTQSKQSTTVDKFVFTRKIKKFNRIYLMNHERNSEILKELFYWSVTNCGPQRHTTGYTEINSRMCPYV